MNKNWRIGAMIAASGLLVTALAGCNAGSSSTAEHGAVVMSYAGLDITIWNDVLAEMKPIVEAAGYELVTHDPQWDVQKQVNDWEAWIQRGDVKAVMAYPVQVSSVVPMTTRLQDAGIPVVGYATKWDGVDHAVLIDCSVEGATMGRDVAEWMIENNAEKETVAVVADVVAELGKCRMDGMVDAMKKAVPDANVILLAGISRDSGYDNIKSHLVANPDTRIFIGSGDDNAQGAYQALLDSGISPSEESYLLSALDASQETLKVIGGGDTFWRFGYMLPADMLAEAQAGLLLNAAAGKPLKDVVLNSIKVDSTNAADYIR